MQISANGIALEVEDHGPSNGEPLVLVMGLGMQLVAWHPDFVAMLVARGWPAKGVPSVITPRVCFGNSLAISRA